jgi:hypothetical protein
MYEVILSLPKLSHPTFTLTLPSTKQEITYRPFLVREEKILLIAQQGGEMKDVVRAIKQIIKNCIVSPKLDVDTFTTFDLEYFFLRLRAKSVNNVVSLTYRDGEDKQEYKFEIDLDTIEIENNPEHTNLVIVEKDIQLVLKYPKIDLMDKLPTPGAKVEFTFEVLEDCMDKLIVTRGTEEEIYLFSEQTKEEVQEFMSSLGIPALQQIQKFFDTMPRLYHELTYTNKAGREQRIELKKLDDFFTLR